MAIQPVNIPEQLFERAKEAAAREDITVEELVRDAVERRLSENGLRSLVAIGDRNVKRTGAKPEDVETEIQAHRRERAR